MNRRAIRKVSAGIVFLCVLALAYYLLRETDVLAFIMDGEVLRLRLIELGVWGPVAIVSLMAIAIMVSPIPSAPIAVAAGAAYGHTWGTVYVLLGAEAGAIGAFFIARFFGHQLLHRWFGEKMSMGWLGSQSALMGIVFISRLLPFVSFDLVSYGAGLTVLSFWRFAIATLAGIVPASFLLAHFGGEMASGQTKQIIVSVVALGGITLIPLIAKFVKNRLPGRFAHVSRQPQDEATNGSASQDNGASN